MTDEATMKAKQGERLKLILHDHGMKQKEFANKIYVSEQTVTKWITGKARIPQDRIDQILELFPTPPLNKYEESIRINQKFIDMAKYRREWLLGKDDYQSLAQMAISDLGKKITRIDQLDKGFRLILESIGITAKTATVKIGKDDEHFVITNKEELSLMNKPESEITIDDLTQITLLSEEGDSIIMTAQEYDQLEKEVKDFIEFKITRLREEKR